MSRRVTERIKQRAAKVFGKESLEAMIDKLATLPPGSIVEDVPKPKKSTPKKSK